ncbi:MAG: hypothetical protein M1837_005096 [Sclerophora amabilis]|nr:MAG: hypothetical protein M1837_005096 [Sclerophora amabilis]
MPLMFGNLFDKHQELLNSIQDLRRADTPQNLAAFRALQTEFVIWFSEAKKRRTAEEIPLAIMYGIRGHGSTWLETSSDGTIINPSGAATAKGTEEVDTTAESSDPHSPIDPRLEKSKESSAPKPVADMQTSRNTPPSSDGITFLPTMPVKGVSVLIRTLPVFSLMTGELQFSSRPSAFEQLHGEIDMLRSTMESGFQGVKAELVERISAVETSLSRQLAELPSQLRAEIRGTSATPQRHANAQRASRHPHMAPASKRRMTSIGDDDAFEKEMAQPR